MKGEILKAKITFYMVDRHEHTFDVEADDQNGLCAAGKEQLNAKLAMLADIVPGTPIPAFWEIYSWKTVVDDGSPGSEKKDGLATRSPLLKVRLELLPLGPLVEIARVFTWGAAVHGDRNWEAGFSWSRCIGSAMRHFLKWCMGEEHDDESHLHHLAHCAANILFLLQYTFTGAGTDDRQKFSPELIKTLFSMLQADEIEMKG